MIDKENAKPPIEKNGVEHPTLSGSESIARAVIDAGARVATSYPGGPITTIVEKLIEFAASSDLYVEWSNCEKVAFEVALGCSLAGRRAVIAAKHVGINHILDPLMTVNLTGSGAGLVILAGDDPGAGHVHRSGREQGAIHQQQLHVPGPVRVSSYGCGPDRHRGRLDRRDRAGIRSYGRLRHSRGVLVLVPTIRHHEAQQAAARVC